MHDEIKPKVLLLMTSGQEKTLFNDTAREELNKHCEVLSWEPFQGAVYPDCDIVLGSWGCPTFNAEVLQAMPSLKMIAYAAGTVKKIMTDAAWERGITITSAAVVNAIPVAEFTVATMVFMAKGVWQTSSHYRTAADFESARTMLRGFNGLNVGLIGASYVGREVIRLLRSYDVNVAVYDPYLSEGEAQELGVKKMDLNQLMAWSDIVSIHAPKLPETDGLVGREQLMLMKDNSYLINTSRGTLLDSDAVIEITPQKNIAVFLDVTDPDEPLPEDHPLRKLENIVITPHTAGARGNEQQRMGTLEVEEIVRFVSEQPVRYGVQRSDLARVA